MNGDGIDDIVAVDEANNNLLVYLSNGDGTFAPAIVTPVTSASGASFNPFFSNDGGGIAVADVNHDGKPDVVTVQLSQGFPGFMPSIVAQQTFLNSGNGNLTASPEADTYIQDDVIFPTGSGQAAILSDLNGDQNPDQVMQYVDVNTFQAIIAVSLGLGDVAGSFGPLNPVAVNGNPNALNFQNAAFQVADLNGDGHPDIVYLVGDGTAAVALGNGDGTFAAPFTALNNIFRPVCRHKFPGTTGRRFQ